MTITISNDIFNYVAIVSLLANVIYYLIKNLTRAPRTFRANALRKQTSKAASTYILVRFTRKSGALQMWFTGGLDTFGNERMGLQPKVDQKCVKCIYNTKVRPSFPPSIVTLFFPIPIFPIIPDICVNCVIGKKQILKKY